MLHLHINYDTRDSNTSVSVCVLCPTKNKDSGDV